MNYIVYKHTAPNNKIYIGITSTPTYKRWDSGNGYKGQFFYRAIQKYGWENIKHEILFSDLTKEEACQKEMELIKLYKSNQREFGYNISNGGNCSESLSEESKKKISDSLKKYFELNGSHNAGKKLSEEHKEKLRVAHTGKTLNDEQKRKISEREKGSKHWCYGKPRSEETKRKISESLKGKSVYDHSCIMKKVYQYDKENNLLNVYNSLYEASLIVPNKHSKSNISACCLGRVKTAYGYVWRYNER